MLRHTESAPAEAAGDRLNIKTLLILLGLTHRFWSKTMINAFLDGRGSSMG
jgi:hypothetical protein